MGKGGQNFYMCAHTHKRVVTYPPYPPPFFRLNDYRYLQISKGHPPPLILHIYPQMLILKSISSSLNVCSLELVRYPTGLIYDGINI